MDDVIGKLTGEQALQIVARLDRRGGNIREAVLAEAMSVLTQIELDETTDAVFSASDSVDVQDREQNTADKRHGARIDVAGTAAPSGKISDAFGFLRREDGPSLSIEEMNGIAQKAWTGRR